MAAKGKRSKVVSKPYGKGTPAPAKPAPGSMRSYAMNRRRP